MYGGERERDEEQVAMLDDGGEETNSLETPLSSMMGAEAPASMIELARGGSGDFSDGNVASPRGWIHSRWNRFDSEVMKPIFGGEIAGMDSDDE